ncbi:MAG: CpaF family protein [Deltaproteobacteria bacterium]|nr:CpaF family protein [Deltaproteobacteria bacterium]
MSNVTAIYRKTLEHFLAPIQPYLDDSSVSEVMINGADEIYVERGGKLERVDARFDDDAALEAAMRNLAQFVGKRLVPEAPSIEARLPDGSRVHIVQAPAARKGTCVAIRKFAKQKLDLAALVSAGALSAEAAEFLGICVGIHKNLIVSGGTGSGKTTLLNCLSSFIDDGERVIVLEDSSELQLQQNHVLPFEVQPADRHGRGGMTIRDLFKASLRMRPDRIVIGECRGGEALDMIQAMTSGHSGSLSTVHANSPEDALNRLETMALMGGVDIPLYALRSQVASAVDAIVQISRFPDGSRRLTHVSEVLNLGESGAYRTVDIFRFESRGRDAEGKILGEFVWTGEHPTFWRQPATMGLAGRIQLTEELWKEES